MIDVDSFASELKQGGADFGSRFGLRVVLVHLTIVAIFGIWWPRLRGIDFFDPVFLSAYACLGVLFSGPAAAQAFSERPIRASQAMVRIAFAVLYGEGLAILILASGVTTVLLTRKLPIGPDWVELAGALMLGVTGTVAMAMVAGWITLRYSPGAARQIMRAIFLGLLVLFFFKSRWLPDVLGRGTSICAGLAILAWFAIRRALTQPH